MPNFLYELIDINPHKLRTDGNLRAAMEDYGLEYLGIQSPRDLVIIEHHQRVFIHRQTSDNSPPDPSNPP